MRIVCISSVAVFMISACSPPPPLPLDDIPSAVVLMFPESVITSVSAFGEARLAINREEYRGKVEVHRRVTGEFSADFYASFGITVGSIRADNEKGTVAFEDRTYTFTKTQPMDALPFTWGQDLTVDDLVYILLGEVPRAFAARLVQLPDSCIEGRKTISALWKTDTLDIKAILRKKSREAEKLAFVFKKNIPFRFLTLESFSGKRAHKIELRENDTNYFSIKYTKLK